MADPIRWGILSTANIAQNAVIPAIHQSKNGVVAAVASRDLEKGRAYAAANHIPKAYGSYDEMLADPEIDAVYNPLPNSLHAEWTMKAASAGKAVLCEKPLTVTASEARQLVDYCKARGVQLAEAAMYRFHPQTERVLKMVRDGAVGRIVQINSVFTVGLPDPGNVRFVKALGGGGILDLGFYPADFMRLVAGDPLSWAAYGRLNEDGADVSASITTGYANGVTGAFVCDFLSYLTQTYDIIGSDGRIYAGVAYNIPADKPSTIQHWRGHWWEDTATHEEITIAPANAYTLMVEDFADALLAGRAPRFPVEDSIRNMDTLEKLVALAEANPLP